MRQPPKPDTLVVKDESIIKESLYEAFNWWSSDKTQLKRHGPLLFFKENEKVRHKTSCSYL